MPGGPPRLLLGMRAVPQRFGGEAAGTAWWAAVFGPRAAGAVLVVLVVALLAGAEPGPRPARWLAAVPAPVQALRPSQAQAASRFLRAVLRADYVFAYGQLAPEVRREVDARHFVAAARPLRNSGQQRGAAIELYKLGVRLGDGGTARLFYTFAFARDSSRKPPPVLLEVTFRDTAARAVLGFSLRQGAVRRR